MTEIKFLKSKHFWVILVSVIVLGGGVFIFKDKLFNKRELTPNNKNEIKNIISESKDSDGDGLADWEEELFGTDPNNTDTDGDGYLDGEEIVAGYDPLKPSPGGKLTDSALSPRPKPGELIENKNLTKQLVANLGIKIMNKDLSFTTDSKGQISQDSLESNLDIENSIGSILKNSSSYFTTPIILDKDIKISDKPGQAEKYLLSVIDILKNNFPVKEYSLFEAVTSGFKSNNFSLMAKYISGYQNSYQEIKKLSIPSEWKEIHKQELGILFLMANALESIKNFEEDPLKALIAFEEFNVINQQSENLLKKMETFIQK